MRPFLALSLSLLSFRCLCAAEWYEQLRPGVTRSEIHRLAGTAISESENKEICRLPQGRIELTYRGEVLLDATYIDPPGGGSRKLYLAHGESSESDIEARRDFLRRAEFENLPGFKGDFVRTSRYEGLCRAVDNDFIVVEPLTPLMGASGFFSNKTRRVLLVKSDGSERTLYSAFDRWPHLRPPNISSAQLDERMMKLRSVSPEMRGDSLVRLLGSSDSIMGSGFAYDLYYLADGLAVVRNTSAPADRSVSIYRLDGTVASLAEWSKQSR